MSVWVSGEKASEHNPGTEPSDAALRQTSVQGDCGGRYDYDFPELAASGIFQ